MEKLKIYSTNNFEKDTCEKNTSIEIYDEEKEIKKSDFSNNIKIDNNYLKKYKIYFYFKLNENKFIFPIITDFFNVNTQYIYDLIKNIVKKINDKNIIINYNNNNNYIVSLRDIEDDENLDFYINNYEIKPSKKKKFIPKSDCPSFSSFSLLKNIENENISFISKNSLNIMLREKDELL